MIDLLIYYAAEANYLRLFLVSIVPVLMAPLMLILFIRYLFYLYDPNLKMTATKLFMFVAMAVILSLIIMFILLYIFLPADTDFRVPLLVTIVIFGLLGAGQLRLSDSAAQKQKSQN